MRLTKKKMKTVSVAQRYLDMMNQWLILKQNDICIADNLKLKGYKNIVIYGMGIYGRHLVRELEHSDLIVLQGIDLKEMKSYHGVNICNISKISDEADVVVNTIIYDNKVAQELARYISCPVLSLEELIFDSYK